MDEAKHLWRTSDKLTQPTYNQLQQTDLTKQLTPAILSFSGIQYQYLAADLLTESALTYLQDNLRILSGFYGILKPFDGIVPYRLEMGAGLSVSGARNLYGFWGNRLYQALGVNNEPIINLASKEYAKAITPYLKPQDQLIDIIFAHEVDGKLKTRATLAKMARGEMVRFMAENQVQTITALKGFNSPNYQYSPSHSTNTKIVFIKGNDWLSSLKAKIRKHLSNEPVVLPYYDIKILDDSTSHFSKLIYPFAFSGWPCR